MICTCYTINNSTVPITHMELMTRQTYKTPEPESFGGIRPFTDMTHSERHVLGVVHLTV